MAQTPREIVQRCLRFERPERIPRELWFLPWASEHLKGTLDELHRRFPSDFGWPGDVGRPSPRRSGNAYAVGRFTDEWGCVFENIQAGVHGEVKQPIVPDLAACRDVRPPYETMPEDLAAARDAVNRTCGATDRYVRAACCPRPWERYQFLRGTENAMIDVMTREPEAMALLRLIHEFYMKELEFWVTTDVDAVGFMDDWGAQRQLLIPPRAWRELFKPLYREYCEMGHAHGKAVFMHTDGHIQEVFADLVEVGVDAINSQLFCMDMAELARIGKGKITFWGEIDRQHVLPARDPQVGREAVRRVARHFYDPAGGVMAQFELTPGSHGPTAIAIFEEWERVSAA